MATSQTRPNIDSSSVITTDRLVKRIHNEKDVIHFKTISPAYKNICLYIENLCDLIQSTGNKILNHKYVIKNETYQACNRLLNELDELCNSTDLNSTKTPLTHRFGHVAFRDWHDNMTNVCRKFINEDIGNAADEQLREELYVYLIDSFGNRMRIDYGTGHELNFILFTMGLMQIINLNHHRRSSEQPALVSDSHQIIAEIIKSHIKEHGWDVHSLFAHKYLKVCRNVQKKFRLEPAGSRGVYNMDDFQFLPFLFGVAQLVDIKYISCKNCYDYEQVDMWKNDFIFFEAIDYILKNKRGPFEEHSYTLWGLLSSGSWTNILRRIKLKLIDDVLSPFPIIQHIFFGEYILRWSPEGENKQNDISQLVK